MSDDERLLTITICGGHRDGETFQLGADVVETGDTFGYLNGVYRLTQEPGAWFAVPVPNDVAE